jgi:hypothetical protein
MKSVLHPASARAVTIALFGMLAISSFELRFLPRHAKDDYRGAAALAQQAVSGGRSVWWSADPEAGRYYGLGFHGDNDACETLVLARSASEKLLAAKPRPDVIVSSKPDAFDPHGAVVDYIRLHHYHIGQRLSGFQIFVPPHDHEADPENPAR